MTFMKRFLQKTGARDFVRSFETLFHNRQYHFHFLNRFLDLLQPIAQMVNVIHRQFNLHEFYALSTNIARAANVTRSEPLPPDVYPLNCGSKTFMPERLYNFLLSFYHDVYDGHLVHYTNAGKGRLFVGNQYCKMKTITLMNQNYHSVKARS